MTYAQKNQDKKGKTFKECNNNNNNNNDYIVL